MKLVVEVVAVWAASVRASSVLTPFSASRRDGLPHGIALGDGDGDRLRASGCRRSCACPGSTPGNPYLCSAHRCRCRSSHRRWRTAAKSLKNHLYLMSPASWSLSATVATLSSAVTSTEAVPQSAPVEGAEIRAQHPAHTRQNSGSQQHKDQVTDQTAQRIPSPPAVTASCCGERASAPAAPPVPAADLAAASQLAVSSLSVIRHRNLLLLPVPGRESGMQFPVFLSAPSQVSGDQAPWSTWRYQNIAKRGDVVCAADNNDSSCLWIILVLIVLCCVLLRRRGGYSCGNGCSATTAATPAAEMLTGKGDAPRPAGCPRTGLTAAT